MERYSEYKDSCVQWIGEVPSHWEVKRLANYFTERKIKVSDKEYDPLSVTKNGVFSQLDNVAKTNDGDNRKLVLSGDFVINSRSDRKGSSGIAKQDGSVSLINIVLKPRKNIYPDFCNYLLKCYSFIEEYYRNGRGIVADLWTTRYDEMKTIKIPVPSLNEQKAIVTYLNKVTLNIDRAIAQQQKMIDLLSERKQIIINNAVTKGLNPDVPMKNSGIGWIGRVPSYWQIMKLKYLCSMKSGENLISQQIEEYGKYKVFGGNGVRGFFNEYNCEGPILLIGRQGALCGNVHYTDEKIWATDHAIVTHNYRNINIKFLYYLVGCMNLNQYGLQTAAQPGLAVSTIKNIYGLLPPIEDQNQIVSFLDRKVLYFEKMIKFHQSLIDLFNERKQIIINDVVTGKVKVS